MVSSLSSLLLLPGPCGLWWCSHMPCLRSGPPPTQVAWSPTPCLPWFSGTSLWSSNQSPETFFSQHLRGLGAPGGVLSTLAFTGTPRTWSQPQASVLEDCPHQAVGAPSHLVKIPVLEYFLGRGAHFRDISICFSMALACPNTGRTWLSVTSVPMGPQSILWTCRPLYSLALGQPAPHGTGCPAPFLFQPPLLEIP